MSFLIPSCRDYIYEGQMVAAAAAAAVRLVLVLRLRPQQNKGKDHEAPAAGGAQEAGRQG